MDGCLRDIIAVATQMMHVFGNLFQWQQENGRMPWIIFCLDILAKS
jgi:hypothetical protein